MTNVENSMLSSAVAIVSEANHILYRHAVLDAFGHVSVRHPTRPNCFLMARNMAPASVKITDIMTIEADGSPTAGDTRRPYLERFIHSEIYKAQSEVGAIVHSHCADVIPFSLVKNNPLRPTYHMAGFIGPRVPVFEIRDTIGDESDMLISSPVLGSALAKTLGGSAAILMRGHGATVVGRNAQEAVFRAIYLMQNARIQSTAQQLGTPLYLNREEAAKADAVNAGQVDRAWNLWAAEAKSQAI
jgi:ribulose-5-phosphate 4-epimerase/fuculose-1-phosphate aldolase